MYSKLCYVPTTFYTIFINATISYITWNRNNIGTLCMQPRQGQLSHCALLGVSYRLDSIN